ncbi:hypothetical protein GDO81_026036 [Engystomops pustulosus]|uniref:Uncharacterized protein n=1 Tax=Engystomops pustulosus TaxID=76066 RepID=A0AAV6YZT2_ENGPU|nr:hypothetical protein GDO81_026036 [Engystomops pustulosus]
MSVEVDAHVFVVSRSAMSLPFMADAVIPEMFGAFMLNYLLCSLVFMMLLVHKCSPITPSENSCSYNKKKYKYRGFLSPH